MKKITSRFMITWLMVCMAGQGFGAPVPPQLSCVSSGNKLSASWSAVSGAEGYTLSYAPHPYAGQQSIGNIDMGMLQGISVDLWEGAAFYLAAQAYDLQGASSAYSNIELCIVGSPAAPAAPTLSVSVNQGRVTLSWTPVPGATGYSLHYAPLPYMGSATFTRVDMGGQTGFAADLPQGAAFAIAVKAYNSAGDGDFSNIRSFAIAPPGVTWYQVGNDVLMTTLTPPDNLLTRPADIAAALESPVTANLGVWSLVKALGLGVYTPGGDVVMQGAETSVDDYWLYDRQIPLLAKAAFARTTISQFEVMLYSVYPDVNWLEALWTTDSYYRGQPDKFLASLFAEMGLSLEPEAEISRLQEYLLTLDMITSINTDLAGLPSIPGLPLAARAVPKAQGNRSQYNICIDRSIVTAIGKNYGQNVLLNFLGIGEINDVKEFWDALFTDIDIDRNVYVDRHSTHVKECGEPAPKVTGQVYITIGGDSDVAQIVATCGRQAGMLMGYQGHNPFPGIPVSWSVSGPGTARVYYDAVTTRVTDMGGSAKIEFDPKVTNECDDRELQDEVRITPSFGTEAMMTFLGGAGWPQAAAAMVAKVMNNSSYFAPQASFVVRYHLSVQSSRSSRVLPRTYVEGASLGW